LQMSFDWSDEEMEEKEEQKDEGKLKGGTLKELTKQYEESTIEIDRLNRVGVEIKRALELRKKMEMCAVREDIGIKLDVKVVAVFDGSMLVYLEVISSLDWTLDGWDLLLTMHPISKPNQVLPCSSSSYRIPPLVPSSSHSIHLLHPSDPSQWPTVIRPSLVKRFSLREKSSYILNIPLPSLLISHLLIFKSISETRKPGQKSSMILPTEFFTKFIKGPLPTGTGSIMNEIVLISTEELSDGNKTRIDIHSPSSSLRQLIISSLECISLISYPQYCPSFSPILPIPSLQSLSALFNSLFPN
ncbi:hypothetical protein PMAYCL1PPCAC_06562, partial [Pristionchus mayeri]